MSPRNLSVIRLCQPAYITIYTLLLIATLPNVHCFGPIYSSSFTWNQQCGDTVACGPQAAGSYGIGYAAANNEIYSAGKPVVGGVGQGCGECWHLQPQNDAYQGNGKKLGTSVVVKINDQCTDKGYCDQVEGSNSSPLNTGYNKLVHFDLCNASGVTTQFFGEIGIGVITGLAEQVDCSELENGPFGSNIGAINKPMSADLKKAAVGVPAGKDSNIAVLGHLQPGGSASGKVNPYLGDPWGNQAITTPVDEAAQQPTTMATVVGSSPAAAANSGTPATGSGDTGENPEQDDCDIDEL